MNQEPEISYDVLDINQHILPAKIDTRNFNNVMESAKLKQSPVLAIVIGTKPDFYKQAPLIHEAIKQDVPIMIVNTGQHYDDIVGFGIKEFKMERYIACNLQIRGDLLYKSSDLLLKFGLFGRYCRSKFPTVPIVPIVHGDTLVAGLAPLSWMFSLGQKVAQNEAGLRSMAPVSLLNIRVNQTPSHADVEAFINSQLFKGWFMARDEPFPEQLDTWVCSAGTQYFFAPTELNKENLIREGYVKGHIHTVGNSVVDAIKMRRKEKPQQSIFDLYPMLEFGEWIRVDIHRRENLTKRRFTSIVRAIETLVKNGYKVLLVKLNATSQALESYGFDKIITNLSESHKNCFLETPLWKEYGNVIEFLDSGNCWCELTDSGSMQEELLYFPKVKSLTVRLSTDRPETIFIAKNNILVPPINEEWILKSIQLSHEGKIPLNKKQQIYGTSGQVSKQIVGIMKKYFEENDVTTNPWLHERLNLWKDEEKFNYL
ncbi:MAG: UDP-N-acetylglucosamine 2-epimerase [Candidatus Nitrosocosmicus sp.]